MFNVTLPFSPRPIEHFPQTHIIIIVIAHKTKMAYHSRPPDAPLRISLNISVNVL